MPQTIFDSLCPLLQLVRVLWNLPEVNVQSLVLGSVSELMKGWLIKGLASIGFWSRYFFIFESFLETGFDLCWLLKHCAYMPWKVKGIKFPVFWSLDCDWLILVGPLTPSPGLGVEPAISHSTAVILDGRDLSNVLVNLVVNKQDPARGTFSIFNNDPLVDEASFVASCKGE